MKASRRRLLKGFASSAAGVLAGLRPTALSAVDHIDSHATSLQQIPVSLAATYKQANEQFGVALLDSDGRVAEQLSLPGRGHDCVFRPTGQELVVFARRPGRFMLIIDVHGRRAAYRIDSIAGRHFYGHGCFSQDGALLYATENDYSAARGIVGVYDAQQAYRRVGEFRSFGVGPHDIAIQNDSRTLIVANGGIETHPDSGRDKLNLHEMRSNLAIIDARNGEQLAQFDLPDELQRLSLRHLALDESGDCFFGAQYEGAAEVQPPLVGALRRSGDFEIWHTPASARAAQKNYISSVCVVPGKKRFVAISSRGGISMVFNTDTGRIEKLIDIVDGSGIGAMQERLYISDGGGQLHRFDSSDWRLESARLSYPLHWDNHLATRTH